MDDVHDGERDGEAGDGQGADVLAEEDAVDDVVDRGHHLRNHCRQGVLPQQVADGFGFEFLYLVHVEVCFINYVQRTDVQNIVHGIRLGEKK